jgi:hypothetical protein
MHGLRQRHVTGDGLFEQGQTIAQRGKPRRAVDPVEQFRHLRGIAILLVPVQRRPIARRGAVQHGGDADQPRHVRLSVARDLQLEPARAVGRDHLFQGLRQTIVQPLGHICSRQGIAQAHRVAQRDAGGDVARGKKGRHVESLQIRCGAGVDAQQVRAHQFHRRHPAQPAQRVDHRPIQQREAERCDQAVQPGRSATVVMRSLHPRVQVKGRHRRVTRRVVQRQMHRPTQLVGVLVRRQIRRLVEPARHHHLGRPALGLGAIHAGDPHPDEGLARCLHPRSTEAEGKAKPHGALEGSRVEQTETQRRHRP